MSSFENQVLQAVRDEFMGPSADPNLQLRLEVDSLLQRFDAVFTYTSPHGEQKQLAVEMDGSVHYYALERNPAAKTELKYRLLDGVGINYLRLEYFDYV